MTPENVPHLCGGILFDLLLETMKPRRKARDKEKGGTDGLKAPNLFAGLCKIFTGENTDFCQGKTLDKCVSNYKKCEDSTGDYVPFTDPASQVYFHNACERKDPATITKATEFINTFLNVGKCEWFAKAIIEVMLEDSTVSNDTPIAVSFDRHVRISDLQEGEKIMFLPFFLSVLDYTMSQSPDCESGRPTFRAWYKQAGPNSEWKMDDAVKKDLGSSIGRIDIVTEIPPLEPSDSQKAAHEEENTETHDEEFVEAEVIDEIPDQNKQPGITFIQNQTNIKHDESKTFKIDNSTVTFNL